MIKDAQVRKDIEDSWKQVRMLQARIDTNLAPHFAMVAALSNFREVPDSLLLFFATSVLETALKQLRDEDVFACERRELGALMHASKGALPWKDFAKVDQVRDRRNKIAHEGKLLAIGEVAGMLDAIAAELIAWKVLDDDIKGRHDVTFG